MLMPCALGQAVAGAISGPIGHHIGTANFLAIGPLIHTAGAIALALWHGHIWALWLELAGLGVGFGAAISAAGSNRCTHALTHDVIWSYLLNCSTVRPPSA